MNLIRKEWVVPAIQLAKKLGGKHIKSNKNKWGSVWLYFEFPDRRKVVEYPEVLKDVSIGHLTYEVTHYICAVLV